MFRRTQTESCPECSLNPNKSCDTMIELNVVVSCKCTHGAY